MTRQENILAVITLSALVIALISFVTLAIIHAASTGKFQ